MQEFEIALYNSEKSFNEYTENIVDQVAANLGISIAWLPQQHQELSFPCVRSTFLYNGQLNKGRHKYEALIQISVFTNKFQKGLANRIIGSILTQLDLSIGNTLMEADVPQVNWINNVYPIGHPLEDMTLELDSKPELRPDDDIQITHLQTDFKLYFN